MRQEPHSGRGPDDSRVCRRSRRAARRPRRARPRVGTPRRCRPAGRGGRRTPASRSGWSPPTTSAASPARWRRCPTRRRWSASWSRGCPGSGRCSPTSTTRRWRRCGSTTPARCSWPGSGRHELTTTVLTAAQVQELVERMLKSSGRRIDISQPFVDAMLPEGHRLHVVLEGISRGFTAVNIRKFVVRASRLHDLVDLGTLTAAAARFLDAAVRAGLNILVAGGTQAGKTTLLNCLASAIPGDRPGGVGRGGLRAALPPPRLGADADPAGRARGHRPDPAARPGQGVPADAAVADHRRRGPRRGVPRPAARAQRRAARDVHAARQQRPRGAGQDVHAAAARRREHRRPVRGAHGRAPASTSSSTSASTTPAYAASTRSSPSPGGWRTT